MHKKQYRLKVQPLTGVHVGSGEILTPLDYTVEPKRALYVKFSADALLARLIESKFDLKPYEKACETQDMKTLQDFFNANFDLMKDFEYVCETTRGFRNYFEENKRKNPLDNAREVLQIYRPAGMKSPVLPGSSIKGSLRTAVLNMVMHDWSDGLYNSTLARFTPIRDSHRAFDVKNFERELQHSIMGNDPKNDIFRTVALGDCKFPAKGTQIVGRLQNIGINEATGETKESGVAFHAEILKGLFMGSDAVGEGTLVIDEPLQMSLDTLQKNHHLASVPSLVKSCNYFYKREFNREYERFYQQANGSNLRICKDLKEYIDNFPETDTNRFLLRIGRWSQVEFVTFEPNFRSPKTPKDKGWGNTRTVFDFDGSYVPLGWCECSLVEEV